MWIRLRLDIGWRDLSRALFAGIRRGDRDAAQANLEANWSSEHGDALACLSVRSGFDLLLETLELPAGSEVLFSAVTIAEMPQIAREHGLVPVPVDVCGCDYRLDLDSLAKAVSPRSRLLVVAHLFGARPPLDEVLEFARCHDLIVVEDCAQAWCDAAWRGDDRADASLFSFGAIKTATALGGAICRVRDRALLAKMRQIQSRQPVQRVPRLPLKPLKFAALKALSNKLVFAAMTTVGGWLGRDVDRILSGLTRGFSGGNLLQEIRRQPPIGTLKLLNHRLRTYDHRRIDRRMAHARRIIDRLGMVKGKTELRDFRHSFWLFPYLTDDADQLLPELRRQGFDTTQRGRMEVVSAPSDRPHLNCPQAAELLRRTLFLPCYPELSEIAIDRMCDVILQFQRDRR